MSEMFKKAIADGASDIHIKAGDFVRARVDGDLTPLTDQEVSHAQVRELALKLIRHERDRYRIDEIMDYLWRKVGAWWLSRLCSSRERFEIVLPTRSAWRRSSI